MFTYKTILINNINLVNATSSSIFTLEWVLGAILILILVGIIVWIGSLIFNFLVPVWKVFVFILKLLLFVIIKIFDLFKLLFTFFKWLFSLIKGKLKKKVNNNISDIFTKKYPFEYWWELYNKAIKVKLNKIDKYIGVKGIYILTNTSNKKEYVGKTTDLSYSISQCFTKHNKINKRIYKDFSKGDKFLIRLVIHKKGMPNLDRCESSFIYWLSSDDKKNGHN